jgi:hypothetical protein
VSITITAAQRDALYDNVLTHLSGIDGLWLAIMREDYATADRLGREFTDDLTLILDDLGWGDESSDASKPIELTTQTDVLHRVLGQLRSRAEQHARVELESISARRAEQSRAQLVVDTCNEVLTALDDAAAPKE